MEVTKNDGDGLHVDAQANVHQVIMAAHEELRQLLQQRAEIMKRIGTVKQTIAGLANLFGEEVLGEDLLELIDRLIVVPTEIMNSALCPMLNSGWGGRSYGQGTS